MKLPQEEKFLSLILTLYMDKVTISTNLRIH